MSVEILVRQPDTPRRRLAAAEDPGRPMGRVPGGWIADNVGTNKCITLCPFCRHQFDARANHYELWRPRMYVVAKCSDCKRVHPRCTAFIPQAFHEAIGEWTRPARRGRWASR